MYLQKSTTTKLQYIKEKEKSLKGLKCDVCSQTYYTEHF